MASSQSRVEGDLFLNGSFSARSMTLPAGSVTDAVVTAGAGISASKLQQQHEPIAVLSEAAVAASVKRVAHWMVYGATGAILRFGVAAAVAAGAASSITVDLKKNGASILTATITLDNTTAAYVLKQPAGFSSTALVAGDVLEADITAVSGANLPKGVFCQLVLREDAN